MANPVVVPLDGSAGAERALPVACAIAGRLRAPLHLVRVEDARGRAPEHHRRRAEAQAYLGAVATRLADQAAEAIVVTVLLEGPVVREIAGYARRHGALLVMTGHGAGRPGGPPGEVADRVVRWSALPVVLVPAEASPVSGEWRCDRILVALDGAVAEATILEPVQRLAVAFGALVSVLRGDPGVARIDAAARELGADLVALGTIARADGGALRYGTVVSGVIRHATVPLLLRCCRGWDAVPGGGTVRELAGSATPAA